MTVKEANEALDRLFDYCEEIDNHIPEEERTGYDMLPDIQALRKFISAENKCFEGMTNGEVMQTLFPECYFLNAFPFEGSSMEKIYIDNNKDNKTHIMTQEDWWNAPYKAESEGTE